MNDLSFFLGLCRGQRGRLWLGVVLSLLTTLASIALLTLSGWFITASAIAGLGDALAFNFMLPAAQIRALAITRTLGRYTERLVSHEATFRLLANIRSWSFQQLIPLVPGRLSLLRSGDILSRLTADIDALDALYLRLLAPALVAVVGIVAVNGFLYGYSPLISLLNTLMLLLGAVAMPWLFNYLGRDSAERLVTLAANFRIRQIDILQGLADLLAYQAYEKYNSLLMECSQRMLQSQRQNNRLTAISSALMLMLSQLTWLLVLILAALAFNQTQLSGPQLALVIFCVLAGFELVQPLPPAVQMLAKTQTAGKRIRALSQQPATITEPDSRQALALPAQLDLRIENLHFRYAPEQDWVLKAVQLNIPYGRKIGIIGASGSGKSTLLQLLLRYYDAEQGAIYLAERNLKDYHSDTVLSGIGFMSQRSQLFAASIKDNLLIAKPNAADAELHAAIKTAGLESLLARLPDGLNTWVGENGLKVSGGEARRITLARLYLKNAPILILDEPTEGLDSDTEQDVLKALANFSKDKTLLMATHRLTGLALVDEVYRMQCGELAQVLNLKLN
ncbi:MAG: thiol reductant ABC exporter subunit CydC [Methylococcales bacterium]